MAETTMVKAEVGERTNDYINRLRDATDMNKQEATTYLLRKAVMSEHDETAKWVIDDEN